MNGSDSVSFAAVDKEKTVADVSSELQKWKEAKERESLKDRLLESQGKLIAMLKKRNEELETELKQKEAAEKVTEKRTVDAVTVERAMQTDSLENDKEIPAEQLSRAEIAAQKLGVDIEPSNEKCEKLERTVENLRNEFDEEHLKYKTMKRLLRAERATNVELHGKLMKMERNVKKDAVEKQIQVDDAEPNEVFISPLDAVQIEGQKRRQWEQQEEMREGNAMTNNSGGDIQPLPASGERRVDNGNARTKATTGKRTLNNRTTPVARHRRTNVGDRRMILRKNRPPVDAKKQSGTGNPINVPAGTFPCAKCTLHVAFASALLLQQHQQRRHSDCHRFPCDQCAASFTLIGNLNVHKKRVHSGGLKPFTCPDCQKCFSEKSDLKKHARVHTGERPFLCAVCQKKFITSSNLLRHERTHSGEKPYSCQHCGAKFNQHDHCWRHQQTCSQRTE